MPHILTASKESVAVIRLNRPDKFNSFNRPMAIELQEALNGAAADNGIRCIYITGEGKAFCAGQDLAEAIDPEGPGIETIVTKHYNPIIRKIREVEKPVVCGVNGVAAGAGANLALACDVVIAAENATFIQAFSKIGLIPDSGGTWMLPRIVGMQRAAALTMLGAKVSAADALSMGMVYQVVGAEAFEADAFRTAVKLAQMPTRGLGLTKRLLNASFGNDLNAQLDLEAQLQVEAANTHDYKEGVNSFLEKRKPVFRGE